MFAIIVLSAGLAVADTPVARTAPEDSSQVAREPLSFTFYAENDVLYWFSEDGTTDQHYTNGVQASWNYVSWPRWLRAVNSRWWPGKDCDPRHLDEDPNACGMYSVGIGQTMYTPRDLRRADTNPNDRPYAGWTYLTANLRSLREHHRFGLDLQAGIIGPAAGARATQSMAHWWWAAGTELPQGWDNQLRNQFGANVGLRYAYQLRHDMKHRVAIEATPQARFQAGTVMTEARSGGKIRVGWNTPPDFLMDRIPVGISEADTSAGRPRIWFAVTGELEARAVVHNALITGGYADGDTWRESLELNRYGRDLVWGVALGLGPISISQQWVRRSAEFRAPNAHFPTPQSDHRFGVTTITLSKKM